MQVMLCQSDLILLHKWDLDDSQSHTTVAHYKSALLILLLIHIRQPYPAAYYFKSCSYLEIHDIA